MGAYRQALTDDLMVYQVRIAVRCEPYVTDNGAEGIADAIAQIPGVRSVRVSAAPPPRPPVYDETADDDDE